MAWSQTLIDDSKVPFLSSGIEQYRVDNSVGLADCFANTDQVALLLSKTEPNNSADWRNCNQHGLV